MMTLDYLSALYAGEDVIVDKVDARRSIRHIIDNLISIKLSMENDQKVLNEYACKFMDLISSDFVSEMVPFFYTKYVEYADKQIKKRIKERC